MRFAPMRFDGMSLRHNPATLTVSGKNRIREYESPCCEADSVNLCRELRRITGEGEFCGADCIAQYQALERLKNSGRRAKLVLPGMKPLYAFLKELELTAKPADDVLSYRFVFVVGQRPRRDRGTDRVTTASAGDSLWDISFVYGVPIEKLVALNPQIPLIDELNEGEWVRLC